jgi:drug/metabolite transporter (DMT)-like permease
MSGFKSDLTRVRGIQMMIASATLVSTSGLIFRNFSDIEIFEVVFYRSFALSIVMVFMMGFIYGRDWFQTVKNIGLWGVIGAAFFAGAQTSYVFAFSHTTVANITFTIAVAPFITALLARLLLAETIGKHTMAAMFLAAIGISILVYSNVRLDSIYGSVFALTTACCFSCFAVILRRNRHIEMLPVLLVTGLITMPIGWLGGSWQHNISAHDIALCFVWGGILQGVGQSLLIRSTKVLKAAEVPLIMLLEFTLGPVWVWIFMDELISRSTFIGGAIILTAVLGLAVFELAHKHEKTTTTSR